MITIFCQDLLKKPATNGRLWQYFSLLIILKNETSRDFKRLKPHIDYTTKLRLVRLFHYF